MSSVIRGQTNREGELSLKKKKIVKHLTKTEAP